MKNTTMFTTSFKHPAGLLAVVAGMLISPLASQADSYRATVLYQVTSPDGLPFVTYKVGVGGQIVGFTYDDTNNEGSAVLWTSSSTIVLTPVGFGNAAAYASNNNQQVGSGAHFSFGNQVPDYIHAFLWSGTAASAVDLNPAGCSNSVALETNGSQQVGAANGQAALWNGTANSFVDLTPKGFLASVADATDGTYQVGAGATGTDADGDHALLWKGTPDSVVDLQPAGFHSSVAYAISGNQQVGYGSIAAGGAYHALLWKGTAASCVDLNPTGLGYSTADSTNGIQQVGSAGQDAAVWTGTAQSFIDLGSYLPQDETWDYSAANSIDPAGNIWGLGIGAVNGVYGSYAVEWTVVPEPVALGISTILGSLLIVRPIRKGPHAAE